MLHSSTKLRFVNSKVGYGIFTAKLIHKEQLSRFMILDFLEKRRNNFYRRWNKIAAKKVS